MVHVKFELGAPVAALKDGLLFLRLWRSGTAGAMGGGTTCTTWILSPMMTTGWMRGTCSLWSLLWRTSTTATWMAMVVRAAGTPPHIAPLP